MPDLLGVTNPVPGYDSSGSRPLPISPNDPQIQNIPDPTRVGRADAKTDRQDSGDTKETNLPKYGSNFQTFLQRLQQTPDLASSLARLLGRGGMVVTSGISEGLAAELSRFLEMMRLDQSQLLDFLISQTNSSSRFNGPLFALLRQAYSAGPDSIRGDILQFVKRYGDYSSTSHIEANLLRTLVQMSRSMPSSWGNQLLELTAQLKNGIEAGDRPGNLQLLQGQIIPLMGRYVDRTHDMGAARALLSMLTLNLSRYENGSEDSLLQSFRQLAGYGTLRDKLGGLSDKALLELLHNSKFASAARENRFADTLASTAASALRGEGGVEMQEAYRNIVGAFLINESVYMPLLHLMVPLAWDDRMLFSELWVDPDAENEREAPSENGSHTLRFLFKMDIQDLGFFDMVLTCRQEDVALQIFCPDRVAPLAEPVRQVLTNILTDNGLHPTLVQVERMAQPLTLSEVFPKIAQGGRSIDVKI